MTLKAALMGYGVASAVIVGAGIWLPLIGVELARLMGWSNSFVGTLFVAFATSVPELATTWGAIRIGAIDMAIGNLLGSNLFDVLILAIDDFAYLQGPIYAHVSPVHAVSAISACLMSGAVIVALVYRPVSRVWHIAIKVLDADKVQHVVRLSGIDAPEKKMPFGQRSKQNLSDLVYGKWVEVEGEKTDRYGRLVGKVLVNGKDANLAQVQAGMALQGIPARAACARPTGLCGSGSDGGNCQTRPVAGSRSGCSMGLA